MRHLRMARQAALAVVTLTGCGEESHDQQPNSLEPRQSHDAGPLEPDAAKPHGFDAATPQADAGTSRPRDAGTPPRQVDAGAPRPDAGRGRPGQPAIEVGTLVLSLSGNDASEATYVLRDAIMIVQGSHASHTLETAHAPSSTALRAVLPVGQYDLLLREGWRLERIDPHTGVGQSVAAVLTTASPLHFVVTAGQVSSVSLSFRAGGQTVVMGALDTGTNSSAQYCRSSVDCGEGTTCCMAGALGTCVALQSGGACPLPDLMVDEAVATSSLTVVNKYFSPESCALIEGCIDESGERRLLAFATGTPNVGEADLILGEPADDRGFMYSACHDHYHYEDYANYELLDRTGSVVRRGHKQAFCLRDSNQIDPNAGEGRYHCGFQGLSAGYSDVYAEDLDCQWIDITGVAPGEYVLTITVNANRALPEANYDNNTISVPVTIP